MFLLSDTECGLLKNNNSSQECLGRMAYSYYYATEYFNCSLSTVLVPLKASKIGFTDA